MRLDTIPAPAMQMVPSSAMSASFRGEVAALEYRPKRRTFLQAVGVLGGGLGIGFLQLFPTARPAAGVPNYSCTHSANIRSINNNNGDNPPCGYIYSDHKDPQYPATGCQRCSPSTVCEVCCDGNNWHKIENCNEITQPVGSFAQRPGVCEGNTDGWHWSGDGCCPTDSTKALVSRCHDGWFILGLPTLPKTPIPTICPKSWCAS